MIKESDKPPALVRWNRVPSEHGPLWIGVADGNLVCRLDFAETQGEPLNWTKAWPKTAFVHDKTLALGEKNDFLLCGTEFQRKVWRELLQIPSGHTVSYAQIARRIGNPKAVRAVGGAVGANPIVILVPCHRVIASDGGIGGYSGGIERKRRLLTAEGVSLNGI